MKNFNKKFWKNKKVFITGHTGFKGSWLCLILNLLGAKIIGYSLKPKQKSLYNMAKIHKLMHKNIYSDICNHKKLKKSLIKFKPDYIFHLAAQSIVSEAYKNPMETFRVNSYGTSCLLDISSKIHSVKKIIIITTDKVYNHKKNLYYTEQDDLKGNEPYSISKVAAENMIEYYIHNVSKKIFVARCGNVLGGGDYSNNRLIPDILKFIKSKKTLPIRNPNHIRPWIHVIEPLIGYLKIASFNKKQSKKTINAFNFGPSSKNTKNVNYIVSYFNKHFKFNYTKKKRSTFKETRYLKLNSNKAKKLLKWKQNWSIDTSLNKVIEWFVLTNKGKSPKKVCDNQILEYFESL